MTSEAEVDSQEAALDAVSFITPEDRATYRQRVASWVLDSLQKTGRTRRFVDDALEKSPGWLNNRLSRRPGVAFWVHELSAIATVLNTPLPPDISDAAAHSHGRISRRSLATNIALNEDDLASAATVEAEVFRIVSAACKGRPEKNRSRDLDWVLRRFGIGFDRAQTLEEIGQSVGLTRERVRQVEDRVLDLASIVTAGRKIPMLTSVYVRVIESVGLPWETVEKELQPFLGRIRLREAIRFLQVVRPTDEAVGMDRASIYGVGNTLRVVARSSADLKLTSHVSTSTRKLYSYAGAAMVHDVRALAESFYKKSIRVPDLVRTMSALPELEWLDEDHRWCWFRTPELSGLLRHAAIILTVARDPVDFETLYAGLVREGRRAVSSQASASCDPVPPSHIVHAMLRRHPRFRRTTANAFTCAQPLDLDLELDPTQRAIISHLEACGGIAPRQELFGIERRPGHRIPRNSFSVYLYLCGFVEHAGPGLWALRGRQIREEDRVAAMTRAPDSPATRPPVDPHRARWECVLPLSDGAKRRKSLEYRRSALPAGLPVEWRTPEGHRIRLVQDSHGDRITAMGPRLKELLTDPMVRAIRFEFDLAERTIAFSAVDG